MTPERRKELAVQAARALEALPDDTPGLEALGAVVLHWASGMGMADAVDAGYRVRWEEATSYWANGYTVRDRDDWLCSFGHQRQADAWAAAVEHLKASRRP